MNKIALGRSLIQKLRVLFIFAHLVPASAADSPTSVSDQGSSNNLSSYLGLSNLGNTCFANASHKLLWKLPEVSQFLYNRDKLTGGPVELAEKLQLNPSVHALLSSLNRGYTAHSTGSPPTHWQGFENRSQRIFDDLDRVSLANNPKKSISVRLKGVIGQDQVDASEYLHELLNALDYKAYFGGVDFVSNKGQSTGIPETTFRVLFTGSQPTTIQEIVNSYLAENRIYLALTRKTPPSHLIIDLVRLDLETGLKNRTPVTLDSLNLKFYKKRHSPEKRNPKAVQMYPVAIICHIGGVGFGHYIAYTYQPGPDGSGEGSWLLHDDNTVYRLTESEMESAKSEWETSSEVILYQSED